MGTCTTVKFSGCNHSDASIAPAGVRSLSWLSRQRLALSLIHISEPTRHDHILFTLDFRQEETDAAQEKHSSVGGHHYSPSLGQDYSRNRSRSHSPREKKSRSESSSRRRSHFNRSRSPHRKRSRSQSPRDRSGRSFRHKRDDSFGSRRADDPDVERRHSSHMQKSQQDCVEGQFGSEDSSYGQEHQHRSKKKSSKHKKHKHKKHKSKSYHSDSEDGH